MASILTSNLEYQVIDLPQYYADILNALPSVVYWVDSECQLRGCNRAFCSLLGFKTLEDMTGTPYEQMRHGTTWSDERIEAFRLDDMKVIFSRVAQLDLEESPVSTSDGKITYFRSRRIPLLDGQKQVIGLVVVLTDITHEKNLENQLHTSCSILSGTQDNLVTENAPKVLMVEDNLVAQKVEESLLSALHCEVDIAESGEKAVQLFGPGKYDLVFMDLALEDTTGYLVAKKLRQMEEKTNFHVPIIALTSYQSDIVKYDCKDYFMDGVLSKPLTSTQAQQIIQHYYLHEDVDVTGLKTGE